LKYPDITSETKNGFTCALGEATALRGSSSILAMTV
jgi:hypothetical protein